MPSRPMPKSIFPGRSHKILLNIENQNRGAQSKAKRKCRYPKIPSETKFQGPRCGRCWRGCERAETILQTGLFPDNKDKKVRAVPILFRSQNGLEPSSSRNSKLKFFGARDHSRLFALP